MSFGDYARETANRIGHAITGRIKNAILPALVKWGTIGALIALMILAPVAYMIGAIAEDEENSEAADFSDASLEAMEQLKRYIRSAEASESDAKTYKNSKGELCYKVLGDGGGGLAVGYGVDIATHGEKFRKLGYSTNHGDLIPVAVVDPIEDAERDEKYSQVSNLSSSNNLSLTQYQLFALTSRTYNYGFAGGTGQATSSFKYPSNLTFVQAYKKYYKKDDNHYGDYTKTDFNHQLYTQYMTHLAYAKSGKTPAGWITRRKSEWCLFQTGYFGWGLKNNAYPTGFDEYCNLSSGVYSGDAKTIKEFLNKMADPSNKMTCEEGKPLYTVVMGSENNHHGYQCKGYAQCVWEKCFGIKPGTNGSPNYTLNSASGMRQVGKTLSGSNLNASNLKFLFAQSQPGDFVQLHWYSNPHSAIVYDVNSDGVTWIQNHRNGTYETWIATYSWSTLMSSNLKLTGISIYRPTNAQINSK